MSKEKISPQQQLARDMGYYADKPLDWVMYAFPWSKDESIQLVKLEEPYRSRFNSDFGPDVWACEFLDEFGEAIRKNAFDGVNAVDPVQMAVSSGHGIGKSVITSWLILFIMSTRPESKGVVTSNTSDQLKTKTWAELGKWLKKCITKDWFVYNNSKGNMNLVHVDLKESWRVDAQTCREENSESFAGLHAASGSPFYLFDEASAIPDKIWEVSEGGMTDGEPFRFAFGNPTRNSGMFRECFRRFKHRWKTYMVDSRTVQITNKKKIQEWLDDYGLNSDFFKVRVRGMFPSASFKQFIRTDDVDAAYGRHLRPDQFDFAPKILTMDPAWEGDDSWQIGLRQGLSFKILRSGEKNDNDVEMANILAGLEDEHGADAVHIDAGYGTGIASVGTTYGRDWKLVWFGGGSPDQGCKNMRAFMWKQMRDWLKNGGAIPEDQELYQELITPETVPNLDGIIQLESKADMKKRGMRSPDKADALALSFAFHVEKKDRFGENRNLNSGNRNNDSYTHDFDPFDGGEDKKMAMTDHDFNPYD